MALSSFDDEAVARLRERVLAAARGDLQVRRVFVPYHASAVSQAIYAQCRVLEANPSDDGMEFVIEGKPHRVEQIVRDSEAAQID